ncbi:hypothetical protein C2S52_004058 [Perilla frutescens var. hirtella]|uniref:Uncharacterized protein n=1 Tax=Perilla frutescens var. hirtella TaxID=608512 RepID=A0AAD4JG47_PERFH|nr:hypothetical protein C2S51_011493 [Perilla frutescens var. frutescens]KAH6793581.1 hypothetical protein C2S52_004058 [Perilla frutescens var. hirtella]KAH6833234.1 hypothetical protein C2S53_008962 [Perilla frutescens var. hirtella]
MKVKRRYRLPVCEANYKTSLFRGSQQISLLMNMHLMSGSNIFVHCDYILVATIFDIGRGILPGVEMKFLSMNRLSKISV